MTDYNALLHAPSSTQPQTVQEQIQEMGIELARLALIQTGKPLFVTHSIQERTGKSYTQIGQILRIHPLEFKKDVKKLNQWYPANLPLWEQYLHPESAPVPVPTPVRTTQDILSDWLVSEQFEQVVTDTRYLLYPGCTDQDIHDTALAVMRDGHLDFMLNYLYKDGEATPDGTTAWECLTEEISKQQREQQTIQAEPLPAETVPASLPQFRVKYPWDTMRKGDRYFVDHQGRTKAEVTRKVKAAVNVRNGLKCKSKKFLVGEQDGLVYVERYA